MSAELTGKREIKQERAARTRAQIARAAAEVFAENGFAGASVTKITQRAGLTLGAMYFHFESKEALAREIVRSQPERVAPLHEAEGLQRAVDITLTWAHRLLDDPFLLAGARLVMEQESFIDPEENSHRQWTEVIADSLVLAQREREVRAGVEVETVSRLIVNACTGAQMHAHLESGRQDLPQRVREIWNVLLPVIATPSALKRLSLDSSRWRAA
ncbi:MULTISPECIES: ScbR family autoregulator-binding transcription factor [Streptomyces]|uniref:Gamma-butyrolactone-binding protein n=1 Tax=Streptomyces cinereoruber TaxID=67260 RepID=A0AAV4KDN5_9ACTN|nr:MULTISPECIES: ScbR family autoregulator-binding transcription factor [unclassified Streptomyces]KYG53308.1 branched-chain amino acid aminotransferase [Streptomyces sp. WAC04657]MBY8816303.1 TetR family transcriptional regulator [Streptomyces cinereoruber]GGR15800.1 gamma-butyrolactone-binding protein [Streptomyces cinereoruber]